MGKLIGYTCLVCGGIWALLGLANVAMLSGDLAGLGVVVSGVVFLLPGLGLCALGMLLARRQ